MKTLKELQSLIINWAEERNIHLPECQPKQRLKLIEECGELASAILKNNVDLQKDAIGDIFVVLVILCEQLNEKIVDFDFPNTNKNIEYHFLIKRLLTDAIIPKEALWVSFIYLNRISESLELDLTECANIAWNEIKDRKGKTQNGTFIKD